MLEGYDIYSFNWNKKPLQKALDHESNFKKKDGRDQNFTIYIKMSSYSLDCLYKR